MKHDISLSILHLALFNTDFLEITSFDTQKKEWDVPTTFWGDMCSQHSEPSLKSTTDE
jgi:hypothetical protein